MESGVYAEGDPEWYCITLLDGHRMAEAGHIRAWRLRPERARERVSRKAAYRCVNTMAFAKGMGSVKKQEIARKHPSTPVKTQLKGPEADGRGRGTEGGDKSADHRRGRRNYTRKGGKAHKVNLRGSKATGVGRHILHPKKRGEY